MGDVYHSTYNNTYCYEIFKGSDEPCLNCPVEKTFADGRSYSTKETSMDKDGSIKHWIVKSSPIFDESGELVAAMEISLDITERKLLEVELERSEKKYHAIFNNIPNPVFVLDKNSLEILDSNSSVAAAAIQTQLAHNPDDAPFTCNNKLIGAFNYNAGFGGVYRCCFFVRFRRCRR